MKKIILTLLFSVGINIVINAQGNLQFNQVKLVSTVETVPAGKVWKVESATYSGGSVFCVGGQYYQTSCTNNSSALSPNVWALMQFNINSNANYIGITSSTPNANSTSLEGFPLWLPAGTTLAASTNMRYLSVIEFNVVP